MCVFSCRHRSSMDIRNWNPNLWWFFPHLFFFQSWHWMFCFLFLLTIESYIHVHIWYMFIYLYSEGQILFSQLDARMNAYNFPFFLSLMFLVFIINIIAIFTIFCFFFVVFYIPAIIRSLDREWLKMEKFNTIHNSILSFW